MADDARVHAGLGEDRGVERVKYLAHIRQSGHKTVRTIHIREAGPYPDCGDGALRGVAGDARVHAGLGEDRGVERGVESGEGGVEGGRRSGEAHAENPERAHPLKVFRV